MTSILRLLPWMLALALASTAAPARADPFTVDHMLRSESFAEVRITPDERHVLFERRGPYEGADRFDLGFLGSWSTSQVWIADRDDPDRARPLLGERGVILGAFSPSGRRLTVHRLTRDRWETGVADLATGQVHWLGVGAEPPVKGETTIWRSDHELILTVRADGDLPYEIGALARAMEETERRRRITAEGGVAATVWGAGAFASPASPSAPTTVLRLDLRSDARTVLAEGQTQDLALSTNGRWLALLDRGPPVHIDPKAPLRPSDPPEEGRLRILDLATGANWSPCDGCDIAGGLLAWSADGRLLVWARAPSREPTAGRLLMLRPADRRIDAADLGGLRPEVGATRDSSFGSIQAAWMGDVPIILAREDEDGRADWRRLGPDGPVNLTRQLPAPPGGLQALWPDGAIVMSGGQAWTVDDRAQARQLEAPLAVSPVVTLTHWASPRLRLNTPPQRRWTVARAADGSLWRLGADRSVRQITQEAMSLRAAGESVAVDWVAANGVETLRLLTPTHPPQPLMTLNESYGEIDFAQPLPVNTPGEPPGYGDSWLYAPPGGLRPETPVIVVAYPGASVRPQENPAQFSAMANVQLLAGLGYAVLTPALAPAGRDGPAAHLTQRVVATLDAALAQYPELDGARVGYVGHSFGAYTGLVLATETERIQLRHSFRLG